MTPRSLTRQDSVIIALITLFIVLSFYHIGSYPIWNNDEGLYAETVREMFERGNFVDPSFNYEHRWQKPVLIYWVFLPLTSIFGCTEGAFRASLGILGIISALIAYLLAQRIYRNRTISLLATLFFVSSFAYILQTRHLATHMLLLLTTTMGLYFLYRLLFETQKRALLSLGLGVSLGLSFLAKGPVGIIITALIALIYIILNRPRLSIKNVLLNGGIIVLSFCAIALAWYIYMLASYGHEYTDFIYHEIFDRVKTNTTGTDPFFYVGAFMGNFAAWSIVFVLLGIKALVSLWQHKTTSLLDTLKDKNAFALIVIVSIFFLFSLSASKLPAYIFPLQPFAAILTAKLTYDMRETKLFRFTFEFLFWLLSLLSLAISTLFFGMFAALFSLCVSVGALFGAHILRKDDMRGIYKSAVASFGAYVVLLAYVFEAISPLFPYERISSLIKSEPIHAYQLHLFKESMPFYAQKKIEDFEICKPSGRYFLILDEQDLNRTDVPKSYDILAKSAYYRGSDTDIFGMLANLKGYKKNDRVGTIVLLRTR